MELTEEQLGYLYYLVLNNGNLLQGVLLEEFPEAEISLVVEYPYLGNRLNLQGAFFFEPKAREAMAALPKEIEQPPRYFYSVMKGTLKRLLEGNTFGEIDKVLIYDSLQKNLKLFGENKNL